MRICVIIPAFNEAGNLYKIMPELKRYNFEILVVDDGSSDNTAKVAQEYGAKVIRNKKNCGKGASLRIGFNYAFENNFDAVITMDADGQHLPQEVINFIRCAENSDAVIFVGNRLSNPFSMPFLRKLTNIFMSRLLSVLARQDIADSQCGFRLIKSKLLKELNLKTAHYETESEILLEARRLGYKIESVPIKCMYQKQKSHINAFIDTLRFVKFIIKYYLNF